MSRKSKTKYTTVYSKSDYDKDEQEFNNSIKNNKVNWDNFQRLMISDLCNNSKLIETGYIGDIRFEDVELALKYPKNGWRIILSVSEALMRISPHYYRLNMAYSNMALFCWWLDIYDVKENANIPALKKIYTTLSSKLETMNLKHEFSKIMKVLPYQDIFCGLTIENNSDFFIQQIDFKICKLYEVQDGLYNFKINLSAIKPQKLSAYPKYVQQAYLDFKDGLITNWYEPPADCQICIKLNSQWLYPYPILIGLVKDILDLDIYKKLKLQSARTDNYKAIMVEVPIDKNVVDKPMITPETLSIFAEINRQSMSDDIGLIYNLGSSGEAISFKDSSNSRNNVADSIDSIYDSSGITKELYNGSSSGTAVNLSIENTSGFIYGIYRQFERWVNRYIKLRKYNKSNFKFNFYLLDTTIFNRDTVSARYKDAASLGVTVIDKWLATLDITPSRMLGSYVLHNEVFNFYNKFKPLQSAYNSSSTTTDDKGGRPSYDETGQQLSDKGEITKDTEANSKR